MFVFCMMMLGVKYVFFFFSSRRRHTRLVSDWSQTCALPIWSAAIIERNGRRTAIVGSLESETVRQQKFYDEIIGYGSEGAAPKLRDLVKKHRPEKIAVNKSHDEGAADGLTSGMDTYLRAALKDFANRMV